MISINIMDSEEYKLFIFSYGNATCYATVFRRCTEQAETASVKNRPSWGSSILKQ